MPRNGCSTHQVLTSNIGSDLLIARHVGLHSNPCFPGSIHSFQYLSVQLHYSCRLVGRCSGICCSLPGDSVGQSATLRTVVAAFFNIDRLLLTVLRSSLLLTLFVEVSGFVICAGIFAACWSLQPSASIAGGITATVLLDTIHILTSFTVGALLVSFVLQTSGANYRMAAQVSASVATLDANLTEIDPRNPSAISKTQTPKPQNPKPLPSVIPLDIQ